MIGFYLAALSMLLIALLIFLLPVLRVRKYQAEEDRTALNVALYQESLDELDSQFTAGALSAEQLAQGKAEAARVLLQDTETGTPKSIGGFGKALPLIAALLIPIAGFGLYQHWGAYDNVKLAMDMAEPPESMAEVIERLQKVVAVQPKSLDALFMLGRTYMNAEQPREAARTFNAAIELAGRQPELLSQWAQAEYFANGKRWNDDLQAAVNEVLQDNPDEPTVLGLIGIAAFESGDFQTSINAWSRLVASLNTEDPSVEPIMMGIKQARQALDQQGSTSRGPTPEFKADSANQAVQAVNPESKVTVQVSLGSKLQGTLAADDSVFVFARAQQGPPMPLAVKRLTVADLPVTLELSDADAMLDNMKLSSFPKIALQARISKQGNPTEGEWESVPQPEELPVTAPVQLVIDQAIEP